MSDKEILKWIYENTEGVHIYPTHTDELNIQSPFLNDREDQFKIRIDLKTTESYAYLIPVKSLSAMSSISEYFSDFIKTIEALKRDDYYDDKKEDKHDKS